MKRHMGIQHGLNLDGTPIDEGHRKKYQAYNKKPTKSKTTEGLASVSAPDEGKPAKSQAHRAPSPVSIPEVKQLSEAPLSPQSSDYYVTLTDEELESGSEGLPAKKTKASKLIKSPARYPPSDAKHTVTERQPSATTSTGANTGEQIGLLLRKPTRPTKPFHSLRRLRHQLDEPKLIPKVTSLITKSKRLVEMRPSSLVKEVHNSAGKSSRQIADELTTKYDQRPTETKAKINEVRVARQAQKSFATEIQQHLRLDADEEERRRFLTWLDEECTRAEGEESDEMV